jgi:ornithine cyclodeaminase/alanine dehydrogenase-like protein (mu-crystallin family)
MTLILSNEDVEALLSMSDCISALEEMYRDLAHERAANALRSDAVSTTARPDAVYSLKLMGGVIPGAGVGAVRLNSDIITYGKERQVKLPLAPGSRYTGLVLLFSSLTGEPLAIFPDGVLQRMRVGAASALGVKYLARADANSVGLIGAGWQAGAQVMAIAAMRRIEVIRCYSPTREKREGFCAEMTEKTGVAVRPAASPEEAVHGAGIVLCATNATGHVFLAKWLEPGMHVGSIRGPELEPDAVRRADVIAIHDRTARATLTTTRGVLMPKTRHAVEGVDDLTAAAPTLGELVAGMAQGRSSPEQTSCFLNLTGIGLQFAAAGAALYRKAREAGRGRELPTEWFTEDVVP